ncbi:MAG: hypothetical protein JXB17_11535, partial [Bacteroidales bacterium]|nr:hypothetical protein [Bacteroidales bacterium]
GLKQLEGIAFDLILSVFTFDNIPIIENRISILKHFKQLLNNQGRIIMLDSTPEMYVNEWTSFSTSDFPQNKYAQSGDKVKIIITDIEDKRPVEDIIWKNEDYLECFIKAGLVLIDIYKPLAKYDEPYKWINETRIAPWVIYVLR